MSLIVYGDKFNDDQNAQSVVLHDPGSRSLVVINPLSGEISLVRQIRGPKGDSLPRKNSPHLLSSYFCPQCGSEVGRGFDYKSSRHGPGPKSGSFVDKNYFKLLEQNNFYRTQQPCIQEASAIPSSLFTPGYYRRFFKELSLLGSGARGSVYKVEHVLMDNHLGVYALKKIHIGNDLSWLELGMKEVKFLSALTHSCANLITYNHVWLEMDSSSGIVKARDGLGTGIPEQIPCIFILQKFCPGGNLEEVIEKKVFGKFADHESSEERKRRFRRQRAERDAGATKLRGLNTSQLLSIIYDIASGLKELHQMNIIHRDLKPSNCLLSETFDPEKLAYDEKSFPTVMIGDFGESQIGGQLRSATGATGTLEFTAPEVVLVNTAVEDSSAALPQFTFQSDLYSLGMVCFFLTFGELPFLSELSLPQLKRNIKALKIDKNLLMEKHRSLNLQPIDARIFDLIVKLLSPDPARRPTATDVRNEVGEMMGDLRRVSISNQFLARSADVLDQEQLSDLEVDEPIKPEEKSSFYFCSPISKYFWRPYTTAVTIFTVYRYGRDSSLLYMSVFLLGLSFRSEHHGRRSLIIATLLSIILMVLVKND
ncbi:LAME_0F18404g1_1 [Lachancea meyersii CBS 8951]|uniref:LAME_0F18404g1_1 n=1 Tax=Lachancea meyersii CBS 8951 TaxID=1266667 RepID=A0A1G4K0N6_9SACH|nr:LAME_0F18404g1_1 [Lachancea meyersii CBS 8951]